jgi:hypothetical protein
MRYVASQLRAPYDKQRIEALLAVTLTDRQYRDVARHIERQCERMRTNAQRWVDKRNFTPAELARKEEPDTDPAAVADLQDRQDRNQGDAGAHNEPGAPFRSGDY